MPSWLPSNNDQGLRVPPPPSAMLRPPSPLPQNLDQNCKSSCRWYTSYQFGACSHSLPHGENRQYTIKTPLGMVRRIHFGLGGPGSRPSQVGQKAKRGRCNLWYAPIVFWYLTKFLTIVQPFWGALATLELLLFSFRIFSGFVRRFP